MTGFGPSRRDMLVTTAAATLAGSMPAQAQSGSGSAGSSGRPDIMFLNNRNLPWQAHKVRGGGAQRRLLSHSTATGAETFVLKLAPGYKLAGPASLGSDFEFFVVRGEIE